MAFWKFTGSSDEFFPSLGLTARPGEVYDFGDDDPPREPLAKGGQLSPIPASKWTSDPGPATDFNVVQASDVKNIYLSQSAAPALAALPPLAARFGPGAADVAITRVSATKYLLDQHLGRQRWYRQTFQTASTLAANAPAAGDCMMPSDALIGCPMLSVSAAAGGSVTQTGTWSSTAIAGTYGGSYYQTSTAADSITYTTPANSTRAGVRVVTNFDGAILKVEIDGDATKATNCRTAQEIVTLGLMPSGALVANGGTLNPTDRVLPTYATTAVYDVLTVFAEGLSPAAHTVKLTNTGYKRTALTGGVLRITAFMSATPAVTPATANTALAPLRVVMGATQSFTQGSAGVSSEWVHAVNCVPQAGGTSSFIGGFHGYEFGDTFTVTVDGAPVTMTDGQRLTGSNIVLTRTTHATHPSATSTTVWTSTTVFTMNAAGLRIQDTLTWQAAVTVTAAFRAMLPTLFESFTKANIDTLGAPFAVNVADGNFYGNVGGRAVALWDALTSGKAAVCLYDPAPDYSHAITFTAGQASAMTVQANSANPMAKAYDTFIAQDAAGTPLAVAAGTVWTSDTYRKAAWFPQGADTVLAGL